MLLKKTKSTIILQICICVLILGCEKHNSKAQYFIAGAREYDYKAHGLWMETEIYRERSYKSFKDVFEKCRQIMDVADLSDMYNLARDYEDKYSFLMKISDESDKRVHAFSNIMVKNEFKASVEKYAEILKKARHLNGLANKKLRKSEYFEKKSIRFYKKAYLADSSIFSTNDLISYGRKCERLENDSAMRSTLWEKAKYKE